MRSSQRMNKQKGFLIPLAIFILVVMSLYALTVSRSTVQNSGSATLELATLQTFYAAESGSYRGMKALFFPSSSARIGVDTRCLSLKTTPVINNFSVTGLDNCSAKVSCTCLYSDESECTPGIAINYSAPPAGKDISFYKITSEATCGTGNFKAVRTIDAGAMMKQE